MLQRLLRQPEAPYQPQYQTPSMCSMNNSGESRTIKTLTKCLLPTLLLKQFVSNLQGCSQGKDKQAFDISHASFFTQLHR